MQTADVESSQPQRETPDRERLIVAEQIGAQYANMPGALIGSAVTASFMAAVLYDKLPARPMLFWLAAIWVVCAVRLVLWKRFQALRPGVNDVERWGRYATVVAACAGVVWGASGIALNIPGNLGVQGVLLLVTIGLACASAYMSAAYLLAYRAFLYPAFSLAALPFLLSGEAWRSAIGAATLAFFPLVLRYASHLNRTLRSSIDIRLQNLALVDELRAQTRAAEEAKLAQSRFLAVASHDLRQPLHAMALFVQALQDATLPVHAQQLVRNVRRSVDSMEELFDSLLDISRLDAGVVRPRMQTVALAQIFERLSFEYAGVAHEKGLSLRVMKTSLYVRSDPTLLARIVRNLVVNAVRYTDHGCVTVGCRRRADHVSVEVWDTGPGIPSGKHGEIFHEFTQLGSAERDRRKGLGLGLAIVARLAKLLDHHVRLRSILGKGSLFAVTVPLVRYDENASLLEGAIDEIAPFDLKGRLALVVQGECDGEDGLEDLLRSWRCDVLPARPGAELTALVCDLRRPPDLIIVKDPGLDGTAEALVDMIRQEFNTDVPALVVGAELSRQDLPVLQRPVSPARLRTLINNLLYAPIARARRAG